MCTVITHENDYNEHNPANLVFMAKMSRLDYGLCENLLQFSVLDIVKFEIMITGLKL